MKTYIVTGASEGLGYELTKILISRGDKVIGLSRTRPDLEIEHISVDFNLNGSLDRAISIIKQKYQNFDAIINCAGVMSIEELGKIEDKSLSQLFEVNVFAPSLLVSGLKNEILQSGADIVNVSSTVGHKSYESQLGYCSSKWALRGVSENLRLEFKSTKTRVISFCPGGFKSKILEKITGIKYDLSHCMEASEVAKSLLFTLDMPKNMEVSEIIINRK